MIQSLKLKIKAVFIVGATLSMLAACSVEPSVSVKHYRLPHLNQPTQGYCDTQTRIVSIDAGIGQDGVMVQESDLLMVEARNNRWLGGLESQLQNSLQRQFTERCEQPLRVTLMQFYGNTQGEAVVAGFWRYQPASEAMIEGAFEQRVPLNNDGYDGLVRALDRAWLNSLADIEQAIKK